MDHKTAIFVFGSNEGGFHGAGAAKYALKFKGAAMYNGIGKYGNSYALPTKDQYIRTLPLAKVRAYVANFIKYAVQHPELEFQVTRVGCGLAGFTDGEIAPLFRDAPDNCWFDSAWDQYLPEYAKFWGTK